MSLDQYSEKPLYGSKALPAFTVLLLLTGLYVSSLYNYLLFHTLVEISCVVISCVIFVLAWNTRSVQDNQYLLFLGMAFLFTSIPELLHTLAYKDFGVFPGKDTNMATQFWIAFRYLAGLSFLIAPIFLRRSLRIGRLMAVYTVVTALAIGSIFMQVFPVCYVEGRGLTPFKIISEYIIILFFIAALFLLLRHRRLFDRSVLRSMTASILASIAAELSFTQYISVFGPANLIGHLFLFLSAYFLYRAIVVTGVVDPSRVLFRSLKESERSIKQSEAKYRSLFENMIDGFAFHKIVVNEQGKPVDYVFLEINSAFERMTGLKRGDIIGRRVTEALPGIERDPADWIGSYGRVALGGQELRFEQHAVALDKWFSVSAYSPMREYFVAVFEDITDRKRAEEALRKSREELEVRVRERTVDLAKTVNTLQTEVSQRLQAEDRIFRLNRLYSVLSKVNEAIVRIHDLQKLYEQACRIAVEDGLFKLAWIGHTDQVTKLVKPVASHGDASGYLAKIKIYATDVSEGRGPTGKAVSEGKFSTCSDIECDPRMLPWRDKALRHGFRSSAAFPIRAGSTVIGAFTLYSDEPQFFTDEETSLLSSLTDDISFALDSMANEKRRLQAEEEIKMLNKELEQRVIERTAQLETANKELEAFAYSVSHDLRAPLRSLDGFSLTLLEDWSDRLDERGRDHLSRIRAASQRMDRLINAMLNMSRLTREELQRQPVDLSALTRAAAGELRKAEPSRNVEFVIADNITVEGDLIMLRALIENLVENSWKFTAKQPSARIEFGVQQQDGRNIYFFRDNGAGFNMTFAEKLFLPFQRLHSASEFPGIGIGLATVKRIIHRHGGKIWAEGEQGKGATFYFTI